MGLIGQLLLQLALILVNAFFACAEIAVVSMNDVKLENLALQGDVRAKRLFKLTSQPAKFLATIQVAITFAGFLGSAFAADNFAGYLCRALDFLPVPYAVLETISVILITLILSYVTLVLGELVPKRLAMKNGEKLALAMSSVILFFSRVSAPFVFLLTKSTNGILRLMGIDPNAKDEEVSEEEIKMMVDAGSQNGAIDSQEQEIIHNLFEFDDTTVAEFATHRTDMVVLWMEDSIEAWEETVRAHSHSLYPVCGETVDEIVGILNVKEYFRLEERNKETALAQALRPPFFVPESLKADVLFRKMQKSRYHFAVVIDEYGGTSGIVTMNDLLEQLVGDLTDTEEETEERAEITQISDDTWEIQGVAPLEEVKDALQVGLPLEEYDTFGGYVFGVLGAIPEDGTTLTVETEDLTVNCTQIENHRLMLATVIKKEKAQDEAEEE
jgi:putative hemolysin